MGCAATFEESGLAQLSTDRWTPAQKKQYAEWQKIMAEWQKQNLSPKQCGSVPKNTAALTCSTESVCCDEAPAALCGSPESTCCYNPEKTVANLCGKGSKCNTNTANCYAAELGQFQCGAIACSEGSVCCEAGYPKAAALCGGKDSTCCYDPVQRLQISVEKALSAMHSQVTAMQDK